MPEQLSQSMRQSSPKSSAPTSHGTAPNAPRREAAGMDGQVRAALARAVEQRVVPALVAAVLHPERATRRAGSGAPRVVTAEEVEQAVAHASGDDPSALAVQVARLRAGGAGLDAIYDGLLTPAARRLGVLWETDGRNFAEVTLGLIRLQNVQRALSPAFRGLAAPGSLTPGSLTPGSLTPGSLTPGPLTPEGAPRTGPAPSVLLMPVPGEHHVFGLSMVADHFAREGWDASVHTPASTRAAVRLVRAARPDVLGLSLACDERVDDAARLVGALRRAAPRMVVLAGGPSVLAEPALPQRIGADAGAASGVEAVTLARALLYTMNAAVDAGAHG